jgi:DNA-binding transcriptional ArsR family regulator
MVTFSDELLDKTFSALAHPIRRAILTRLTRDGSASVSDLAEPFDVSLMAVSKHLKVMDEAGLIRREKDGRIHRCSVEMESMDAARAWIDWHRRFWTQQLDSLATYLEIPDGEGPTAGGDGGGLHDEQGEDV